jgi:hypothetical protein
MIGERRCAHCGFELLGYASVGLDLLCHPDFGIDCYRLVTIYHHDIPCRTCHEARLLMGEFAGRGIPLDQPFADFLTTDCQRCDAVRRAKLPGLQGLSSRMIVCSECGNKRCPKASDHDLACTHSNDSGQPGSIYV